MTTCEKHGCPLTPLFTSAFCARCDEEAAVNAPVSSADADFLTRLEATLMESSDAAHANAMKGILGIGPGAQDTGWYHNYPVCGTDANGSDVDDMDVCMGMVVGRRHLHKVGLRQEALDALRKAQETPQPKVAATRSPMMDPDTLNFFFKAVFGGYDGDSHS